MSVKLSSFGKPAASYATAGGAVPALECRKIRESEEKLKKIGLGIEEIISNIDELRNKARALRKQIPNVEEQIRFVRAGADSFVARYANLELFHKIVKVIDPLIDLENRISCLELKLIYIFNLQIQSKGFVEKQTNDIRAKYINQ